MSDAFHLLDLHAQALAVEKLLSGRSESEKVQWLSEHGRLGPFGAPGWYWFESWTGMRCCVSFKKEKLVFMGDNTTYSVKEETNNGSTT